MNDPTLKGNGQEPQALPNPFETVGLTEINPDCDALMSAFSSETRGFDSGLPRHSPNFPAIYPVVYHNIAQDIPARHSLSIRLSFFAARSFSLSLILNFICALFSSSIQSSTVERWREIILSGFLVLVGPVLIFRCQYFPLYFSVRDERPSSSLVPMQFFVIFCFLFVLMGVPGSGIAGIWYVVVALRFGTFSNKVLSILFAAWSFVNVITEVIVLLAVVSLSGAPIRVPNPADIA